jgi:hypothetical protein
MRGYPGHSFAISSEREGITLYSRCNFARRAIYCFALLCFDLTYPQEEKRAWMLS